MCLAVPLKLIKIDGNVGVGERGGITRELRLDFIKEPKLGDYVMLHAGFAIEKVDPAQAEADLESYDELDAALAELGQAMEEIRANGGRY